MVINDVYIEKTTAQVCCTCACWTGIRVTEADGFVYSLADMQGLCKETGHGAENPDGIRLTYPGDACRAWQAWHQSEIDEVA